MSSLAYHRAATYDEFTKALLDQNDAERIRLEASMIKVQEIFLDTQEIALAQGVILDRMDVQTTQAVGHTSKAVEELEVADRRLRRKKYCVCSVMVLTVLGTVLVIAALSVLIKLPIA
jgi:t-SNARE complex subunit (syntaxin)